jgi:hypothetical protein
VDLWVGYKVSDWLDTGLHVQNIFSELGPTGQYRTPLNPVDTAVVLELGVSFDNLYKSARGLQTASGDDVSD